LHLTAFGAVQVSKLTRNYSCKWNMRLLRAEEHRPRNDGNLLIIRGGFCHFMRLEDHLVLAGQFILDLLNDES
jgi:hypothetical protein